MVAVRYPFIDPLVEIEIMFTQEVSTGHLKHHTHTHTSHRHDDFLFKETRTCRSERNCTRNLDGETRTMFSLILREQVEVKRMSHIPVDRKRWELS